MFRTIININTRRSFHLTSIAREEWTKASLRRMKKPELVHLAKENNLKLSGTKNEIIIQLLTHQTAKIVGVETPSSLSLPKTKAQPAFGSLDIDSFPNENSSFEVDNAWTEAFEMKVAQRGSRKPTADAHDHFTSRSTSSTPHPMNKQIKPKVLLQHEDTTQPPIPAQSENTAAFEPKKVEISEELEGMDPQWVEAFDLKVGSRGARRDLTDTLSPTTSPSLTPLEDLEFITLEKDNKENTNKDNKEKEHNEKDINEKNNKEKDTEVKDVSNKEEPTSTAVRKKFDHAKQHSDKHGKQHFHNDNKQDVNKDTKLKHEKTKEHTEEAKDRKDTTDNSSREKWINTTVGSSMILWYIGGEEGISKLWHFLTSSS
ncbi:hypothetical protein BDF21DRAFT_429585 [Thamnidium elegans]|uniref:SAP domain-containing protein n=1 Tax=Thamnidium elegans TaxID=101142 RepID=A0A8H7W139_9FUNG|nr:hypothetical protein INT48_003432 [Thamnidium elegans]KAI8059716.1 hypothetical protein BDF21DRAFT_429585 [Thamnidium elegans]